MLDNAIYIVSIVIAVLGLIVALYVLINSASKKQVNLLKYTLDAEIRNCQKVQRHIRKERRKWNQLSLSFQADRMSWYLERSALMDEIKSLKYEVLQLQGKEVNCD